MPAPAAARRSIAHRSAIVHCGAIVHHSATVIALLAALAGCGQSGPGQSGAQPAASAGRPGVQARIIEMAPQSVSVSIEALGQVEGSREVEVRARVPGILQKRIYVEGDLVRADAALFQIDPAPFEIVLAQARAQLQQERARNEQAKRESARLKELAAQKAISQREYDDASSNLKLSDASVQLAEARVRDAELNLSYTLVKSPVAGITGRSARSEGSLITAGADSLLTTVNQIHPIWVRFSLAESDNARLPGGRLKRTSPSEVRLVLQDGSPYPGKGRLNFAATQIDLRLGTQQMRAEFDNPQAQLLPGQFVRVRLTAGQRSGVFLVPQTAVLQNEKGYFLFVLDGESKASVRPVRAGDWVGTDWMILDGLKPGDRVIVDNLLKLQPGVSVRPLDQAGAEAAPAPAPAPAPAK